MNPLMNKPMVDIVLLPMVISVHRTTHQNLAYNEDLLTARGSYTVYTVTASVGASTHIGLLYALQVGL